MIRNDFNSVDEFCNAPFVNKNNQASSRRKFQSESGVWLRKATKEADSWNARKWFGADNADQAAARVTKGWPEGAKRLTESMEQIDVDLPMSVRRKLSRGDQGDELDIHAVYAGNLANAWSRKVRKHTRAPLTVRIVIQTNLLSHMGAQELFWRGASAVKLSDLLVAAGYNVEIIGALASSKVDGRQEDFLATMVLKESLQPLDIEQLAGVVCNAGFHRLFGFRAYDALIPWTRVTSDGDECATNTDGRVLREANFDADGVMTFMTSYDITSLEAARKFVADCCNTLNSQMQEAA